MSASGNDEDDCWDGCTVWYVDVVVGRLREPSYCMPCDHLFRPTKTVVAPCHIPPSSPILSGVFDPTTTHARLVELPGLIISALSPIVVCYLDHAGI